MAFWLDGINDNEAAQLLVTHINQAIGETVYYVSRDGPRLCIRSNALSSTSWNYFEQIAVGILDNLDEEVLANAAE
jgi:hypothetical protein